MAKYVVVLWGVNTPHGRIRYRETSKKVIDFSGAAEEGVRSIQGELCLLSFKLFALSLRKVLLLAAKRVLSTGIFSPG